MVWLFFCCVLLAFFFLFEHAHSHVSLFILQFFALRLARLLNGLVVFCCVLLAFLFEQSHSHMRLFFYNFAKLILFCCVFRM